MRRIDRNIGPVRRRQYALDTIEIKLNLVDSFDSCVLKLSDINNKKEWETVKQNGHSFPLTQRHPFGNWSWVYDPQDARSKLILRPQNFTLQFINLLDVPIDFLKHFQLKGAFLIEDYGAIKEGNWEAM